MIAAYAILAGAVAGAGLTVLVHQLLPSAPPQLGAALARLDAATTGVTRWPHNPSPRRRPSDWQHTLGGPLQRLADTAGLPTPHRQLELTGVTPARWWLTKAALVVTGLALPPLLTAVLALIGTGLPVALPAAGSIALAVVLFFVPDVDAARRAGEVRREFHRAICSYLDLVALERLADAGAVEALERAAAISDGWAFVRIRDALTRAHLAGDPPWNGLHTLADQLDIPELADVADIMSLSGEDGAAVYDTLRSRADSLRQAMLSSAQAEANTASEKLIIPVAALGLAFLALLGYPALARILTG